MNKAKTMIRVKKVTKPFKTEFMKNQQKGQKVTEPTEAKTVVCFPNLQNVSYLQNRNYKTISFTKKMFLEDLFPVRIVSETSRRGGLSKLTTGI
jgi:hypothetical protein